ncbi:MAG: DNA internalization-related competence protein ComEC/Rec2 [Clostridia bacterium]|nr:DNA internalization-related competence protein ComEC/Rec2 [Clostridia bacterium]
MEFFLLFEKPMVRISITVILAIYMSIGENKIFCCILIMIFIMLLLYLKISYESLIICLLFFIIFMGYGFFKFRRLSEYNIGNNEKTISVEGTITSINSVNDEYAKVTLNIKGMFAPSVQVKIYEYEETLFPGMKLKAEGLFLKPVMKSNPGGYDEEKYMYANNICGKLFCYSNDVTILASNGLRYALGMLYHDIKKSAVTLLGDEYGNILAAMQIGAKEEINDETITVFRVSGLSHTMAVSGSHVMYLMTPLLFIFSKTKLKRRRYYPIIMVVLLLFSLLTCLKPSVVRATVTALVLLSSDYFYEQYDPMNALGLSMMLLVIANPISLFDSGFILSYTCVVSILIFYNPLISFMKQTPLYRVLILTLSVQIGIVMVSAKIFYTFYTFSYLVNILVLPVRMLISLAGWLMYFLNLFFTPATSVIAVVIYTMLDYIMIIARFFSQFKISTVSLPYISSFTVLLYFLFMLMLCYGKDRKKKILIFIVLLFSVFMTVILQYAFNLVFFDVGQGDCALVKCKDREILIDCGEYAPLNSISYYTGDEIDYLMISHSHDDHMGGAYEVIERFNVKNIMIPDIQDQSFDSLLRLCDEKKINVIRVKSGDEFTVSDIHLTIFNPGMTEYRNQNNSSIVCQVTYKDLNILFTGDIEKEIESTLLFDHLQLSSEILKVSHHGSDTSTSTDFLNAVDPLISIISVGYNSFGHPDAKTLEILKTFYRTDQFGAIIIKYKKNRLMIETGKR